MSLINQRLGLYAAPDTGDGSGGTVIPPAPTSPPAPVTPPAADPNSETWMQRFISLQGKYQQVVEAKKDLDKQLATLNAQVTKVTGDFEGARLEKTAIEQAQATLASERDALKAAADRLRLVASEFPDLLALELQGLLPGDMGDALKAKLVTMREALKRQGATLAVAQLATVTPTSPQNPPAQKTPQDWLNDANALMKAGKIDEYNAAYDKYIEALQNLK